ncbi:MAG: hypothetical protein K8F25_07735 [Fimbriimonadaceae bacterium]|nr:hypothetical protein [Alphaproteobacteria bacterium]
MSDKKSMRSPLRLASIFLWALLSVAAGALAVETILSGDSTIFTASLDDRSVTREQSTPGIATQTRLDSPADTQTGRNDSTLQHTQNIERQLTRLSVSLNEVMQNNADLILQQKENADRLTRMEDAFESMTASLTPVETPPPAPEPIPYRDLPLPTLKPDLPGQTTNERQNRLMQSHVPFPANSKDALFNDTNSRQINPDLSELPTGTQQNSQVRQTEFAVSVAHFTDIEILVQSWLDLRERYYDKLENLEPRIRFENSAGNGLELALIAGPLRNAADAASLCAALGLAEKGCKPVVFSGEVIPSLLRAEVSQ